MIEQLKLYDSYKSPGLRWVERIPSHWKVDRARSSLQKLNWRSRDGREELLTVSTARGVVPRKTATVTMFKAKSYAGYKLCWPGDLVINSLWAWAGGLGVSRYHGIISSAYGVYRSRPSSKLDPRYLHELVRSAPFNWELQVRSKGIWISRLQLSDDAFLAAPVLIPPPDEQAAIVRFLDDANRHIDQFIRAKKKLIALLNEQKQAIIHRAVTGGISSDSRPQIERGVFLGSVPRHWPIKRAKYLFRQVVAPVPENAEQVTCFRDGQVTLRRNRRTTGYTEAIYELGYQGISPGQLVVHSMDAFAGAIGVSDSSGKCSPEYVILEPESQDVDSSYYALLLRNLAVRGLFKALCPSVRERAPRVRFNDFGSFALPVPPLDEQIAIVGHIKQASLKLGAAVKNARDQLDRVQEYRTRLVADVVTGQLDVRAAAAGLPAVDPEAALTESEADETDIEDGEAA